MGILDSIVGLAILGGGGYLLYMHFYGGGMCGGFLGKSPICMATGALDFFKQQYNTGDAGVPFQLEDCPSGHVNFGLTCTACAGGWDFFTQGCHTVGRLDNQQCPKDHPDKIGLLCYKKCPAGWIHTEAMPYLCRNSQSGNFWDMTGGRALNNFWDNLSGWGNFAGGFL